MVSVETILGWIGTFLSIMLGLFSQGYELLLSFVGGNNLAALLIITLVIAIILFVLYNRFLNKSIASFGDKLSNWIILTVVFVIILIIIFIMKRV